jgi:hypothetical protein
MERPIVHTYHVTGALAADLNIRFKAARDMTLVHVSAVGSNAYQAGLQLGTGAAAEAHLAKASIGASNTPVEFGRANFVDQQYPRLQKGDIFALALDYDYNNGGASQASANVSLVLTFVEG